MIHTRICDTFTQSSLSSLLPYYYSPSLSSTASTSSPSTAFSSWPSIATVQSSMPTSLSQRFASSSSSMGMGILWPPTPRAPSAQQQHDEKDGAVNLAALHYRQLLFGVWLRWHQFPSSCHWQYTNERTKLAQLFASHASLGSASSTIDRTTLLPLIASCYPSLPSSTLTMLLQCL
jgi:hypothetical protein